MLYISRAAARREAENALRRGVADDFQIVPRSQRCGDRSVDTGFVVRLSKAGRFVGIMPIKALEREQCVKA